MQGGSLEFFYLTQGALEAKQLRTAALCYVPRHNPNFRFESGVSTTGNSLLCVGVLLVLVLIHRPGAHFLKEAMTVGFFQHPLHVHAVALLLHITEAYLALV